MSFLKQHHTHNLCSVKLAHLTLRESNLVPGLWSSTLSENQDELLVDYGMKIFDVGFVASRTSRLSVAHGGLRWLRHPDEVVTLLTSNP